MTKIEAITDNVAKKPDYYSEAKSWYTENYESIYCSRNRYRILTFCLLGMLVLNTLAIFTILPLKKYYYRILEVNDATGEVRTLKEMEENKVPITWTMNRYWINKYIQDRESYSLDEIRVKYNSVIAMSSHSIADEYISKVKATNPNSPINKLGSEYSKQVKVISINKLNENTALARFRTITRHKQNQTDEKVEDWQVALKWEYVKPAEAVEDRDKNPLGFSVQYYQPSPTFSAN